MSTDIQPPAVATRYIPVFLGALLLGAGVLKVLLVFEARWSDLVQVNGFPPWVLLASGEFELVLAVWLWSGYQPRAARLVTLLLFAGFLSWATYAGLQGRETCGCFGNWRLSPWVMAFFDSTVMSVISIWRPGRE